MSRARSKVFSKLMLSCLLVALSIVYFTYEADVYHAFWEFFIYLVLIVWLCIISPLMQHRKYARQPKADGAVIDVFRNERSYSEAVYIWVEFIYEHQLVRLEEEYNVDEVYPQIGDMVVVSVKTTDLPESELIRSSDGIIGKIIFSLIFLVIIGIRLFTSIF